MSKIIFIDIDNQNDFILENGRLSIKGAESIIPVLERLTRYAEDRDIPILATQDTHTPDDPEFETFPPHCVDGSYGHKKISETVATSNIEIGFEQKGDFDWVDMTNKNKQIIFRKNTYDAFTNPSFTNAIQKVSAEKYVVYGVATDYCVKSAVLGLRKRGKPVYLVVDAIKEVDEKTGEKALDEMKDAGAKFLKAEEILQS